MSTPLIEKKIGELEAQITEFSPEKQEQRKKMIVYATAPVFAFLILVIVRPGLMYDTSKDPNTKLTQKRFNKTRGFILFMILTGLLAGGIYYAYSRGWMK